MAYTEQRGKRWRVRWKLADGTYSTGTTFNLETGEHFETEPEAKQYGEDKETLIRLGLYKEKDRIKFGPYAATWFSGLDLEHSTWETYLSIMESHVIPRWEHTWVDEIELRDVEAWERGMIRAGYAPRTAKDARRLLGNALSDAIPKYIDKDPTVKPRGKGRKGLRRIAQYQQAAKVWASPEEVVLIAERAALLARDDDLFLKLVTKAWTGGRWSEITALSPEQLTVDGMLDIDTKLYQATRGFYLGYPKDGSLRVIDLPDWLLRMLQDQAAEARHCGCRRPEDPGRIGAVEPDWCEGGRRKYLFLTPDGAHYQRGTMAQIMGPAASGVFQKRKDGGRIRPERPVLVDVARYIVGPLPRGARRPVADGGGWPGQPLTHAWPYAVKGEDFEPPRTRGRPNFAAWPEAEQPHLMSWRPIRADLTPHGLRHSHQTWLDDGNIKRALKTERMGHEDLSMPGRYGHITERMRVELAELLAALWENAIGERFKRWPSSPIPLLDRELARWRIGTAAKVVSHISPRNAKRALTA
ncbi:hypothetical protein [Herbidospora mongoliensis]|uniref:hypothetical protein n=1 Tax=Herbidospora mongoliensis TaxID=688067 RepID=UPI00083661F5|nr:hypothetical protein [Herbidospora mongoliensis]